MTYPNFKNKHLEEALFNPKDFIGYKKIGEKFPKKFIIIYDRKLLARMKREYALKKFKSYYGGIYQYQNIGILVLKGIGSPHAVSFLEDLISLGVKEFINIGLAGGLQKQGFFLCEKALRDEGTSYHYIPRGKFSYPDEKLTEKLGKSFNKLNIKFEKAPTWTIDAPYRETKAEILEYKKEGIATVEMEASALFAVAKFRKVKIASAFVVSDILGERWEPQFHKMDIKKGLNKLFEAAVRCLQ